MKNLLNNKESNQKRIMVIMSAALTVYEVADRIGDTVAVVLEHYYQFFNQSKIDVANKITDKTDENIISLFEDDDD